MESKVIQMRINPHKEPLVYNYLKKLEFEGSGEKGYENKKIVEIIRAWVHLMDMYDETDNIKLAMTLARGIASPPSIKTEDEVVFDDADENEEDFLALLQSAKDKVQKENQ
jgi:uncharacterized UPF0160 family protein